MNSKGKALKAFKIDEKKGISEYKSAIKKTKGQERSLYKKILPDEKKHLHELKEL